MKELKRLLRKSIQQKKNLYTPAQLVQWSSNLLDKLEGHPVFRNAHVVLLYYALPDEVQTQLFIEKWSKEKMIILPVIKGEKLELRCYNGMQGLRKGSYNIEEPTGPLFSEYAKIDLAIIPGVAFDAMGNRLGRGKGYYDRLLPYMEAYRIGICFGFQVIDGIPAEPFDCVMNEVWTEKGRLSKK